jgi:hypothetical protein
MRRVSQACYKLPSVAAVGPLLDALRGDGYEPVTVSELLGLSP